MERITSRDNEKIKQLIRLQTNRKARRESDTFVAEGVRLAQEVLRCGLTVLQVFATEEGVRRCGGVWEALCQKAEQAFLIHESLESRISEVKAPQGVYCVCRIPHQLLSELASAGRRFLALDRLQDPGNMGTIIRTADALGADGIIAGEGCADVFSPKVLRSTMGSAFRMKIWTVEDLAQTMKRLRGEGFGVYGAALDDTAVRLGEITFPEKTVVIVGNEGNGISDTVLQSCDGKLFIPMKGEAESLNAGVAASLILWEMCR